jgi:transcriptional antiterminator RfaH
MDKWYVAYTHVNREVESSKQLEQQGFEAYLPRYLKNRRHARKSDQVSRPLFPRYLFIKMDLDHALWRAINSTRGIINLISNGDGPTFVMEDIVEGIKSYENESGLISPEIADFFKPGDPVQVTAGAMIDQIGLFRCRTDNDRVIVLFNLMGREMNLSLPADTIWSPA